MRLNASEPADSVLIAPVSHTRPGLRHAFAIYSCKKSDLVSDRVLS
jgi:hypothetical protein